VLAPREVELRNGPSLITEESFTVLKMHPGI